MEAKNMEKEQENDDSIIDLMQQLKTLLEGMQQ